MTIQTERAGVKAAARLAYVQYLRTGRHLQIEEKLNPWHDRGNGRFTFGPGGELEASLTRALARSDSGAVAHGRNNVTSSPSTPRGPLQSHASRRGPDGDVARAINTLVTQDNAKVSLMLNGETIKVRRLIGNKVELSMAAGQFIAHGNFEMMQGRQGVSIHVQDQKFGGLSRMLGSKMTSFPREIAVFSRGGQLIYSLDRPIIGTFGGIPISKKAGEFYVSKPKR